MLKAAVVAGASSHVQSSHHPAVNNSGVKKRSREVTEGERLVEAKRNSTAHVTGGSEINLLTREAIATNAEAVYSVEKVSKVNSRVLRLG